MRYVLVASYLYLAFAALAHSNIELRMQRHADGMKASVTEGLEVFNVGPKPFWEIEY